MNYSRVVPQGQLVEMLELYYGKLSRTVLRRESGSNARDLSGNNKILSGPEQPYNVDKFLS